MAEYAGARRAAPALSDAVSELSPAAGPGAASQSCPQCGSLVRADQKWCTLCLHVLHEPEPQPQGQAEPDPEPQPQPAATAVVAGEAAAARAVPPDVTPSGLSPETEAVADALIAQLASQTRQESFQVPSFLRSKSQRAVAIVVVTGVLSTVVFAVFDLLGAALH